MNLYRETSLYIHTIHASHLKITPLFLETRKEPLCLMWLRPPASHEGFPPFEQLALCQRHKACTRRLSWGVEYDCCQVLTSSSGSTCCFLVFFFATVVCSHTKIISCDKEISTMHMFIQKQDGVKIDHIWNLEQFNIQSICSYHVPLPLLQWRPNSASFSQVIKLGCFKSRIQWSKFGRVRKTKSWIPFHVCPLTKCI